jgi:YVTN family beta-propeller protein
MKRLISLLAAVLCTIAGAGHAAEPAVPLVVERTIALKGVSGRIDHLAIDLGRKRLFVAELGNGTVDVIDLDSASVIRRIEGLKEPQGLAYAPAVDVLAVRAPAMDRCASTAATAWRLPAASICATMPTISGSIRAPATSWWATAAAAWP